MIVDKSLTTQKDLEILKNNDFENANEKIDFSDIIVKKPWGEEYLLFENDDVAIWILKLNPNTKTSMHCHPKKNTSLICLSGKVTCDTFDSKFSFNELEGIYLGKKVYHQTSNDSQESAYIMEIESPVDKFDLVRYNDNYGRSGKAYENSNNYIIKKDLTIKNVIKNTFFKNFDNLCLEIGYAKTKEELFNKFNKDKKTLVTLLDRHIWSKEGLKEKEVGQIMLIDEEILRKYNINDNFIYLIIKKD